MKDREKILHYFSASGEEYGEMTARLLDLAEAVERGRPFAAGPFMPPFAAQIGATIAAHAKTVTALDWGGYHGAERVRIAFKSADYDGPVDFGITALSVTWDARYRLIGHRDILGALLGLGIDRSVLGDILMQSSGAQILADRDIAPWLKQNFLKAAMVPVHVEEIPETDITPPAEEVKEVRTTVASLRLDAVGAAGFGVSRTKMAAAIDAQRVQVNWQTARSSSRTVEAGDVISIRGRGRIELKEITGMSRKGRTGILIKKYK